MFKVGDKVRIKEGCHYFKVGSKGTVTEIIGFSNFVGRESCFTKELYNVRQPRFIFWEKQQILDSDEMELLKTRYKMFKKIQEWWDGLFVKPADLTEIYQMANENVSATREECKAKSEEILGSVKSKPAKKKRAVKKSPAKKRGKK